ncbi:MAG: hypothetical protein ACYDBJ_00630 [Aggregatilineales bacterium]
MTKLPTAPSAKYRLMPWSRYIVIALTLVNGITALQTLNDLPVQTSLGVSYPPLLRGVTAAIWAALFVWLTFGIFRHSALALRLFAPTITAYSVFALLWLVVFARADFDRGRTAFQFVLTLIILTPIWWWHVRVPRRTNSTRQ